MTPGLLGEERTGKMSSKGAKVNDLGKMGREFCELRDSFQFHNGNFSMKSSHDG